MSSPVNEEPSILSVFIPVSKGLFSHAVRGRCGPAGMFAKGIG